ncbi:PucR family transcriptional regulator ligand-binding domain-containing protein, partial [Methanocalculus natronophilus]|uniref:PucR family transcriptional regulator ligand-binding domain-containing protein n=1 Tax=Methanocalculus natronophilus TaxID=1262400 RepID=UPI0031B575CA
MALTIKKLTEFERLKGFRMVAGSINSNNEVHNINTIDNPDSYEWFTAGDFLLTTGYIYKDYALLQKNLIKELAQMNISGLGIKIKRYWD